MPCGVTLSWAILKKGQITKSTNLTLNLDAECENDCRDHRSSEYDIHTVHASYLIPNVMKMKNFTIYLGAYASWVNASPKREAIRTTIVMAVVCGLNIISKAS